MSKGKSSLCANMMLAQTVDDMKRTRGKYVGKASERVCARDFSCSANDPYDPKVVPHVQLVHFIHPYS